MATVDVRSRCNRIAAELIDVLPLLAFFVVLFFGEYALFGVSDALLGIVFLFFARAIIDEPGLSFVNYLRRLVWFFVMSVMATLAGLNPIGMVIITAIYLFVTVLLHSDDYFPRNFFWLGMGYLMLLIYPVGIEEIGTRSIATLISMGFTTLFIFAMRAFRAKTGDLDVLARDRDYVKRAFDDVGHQLMALASIAGKNPDEAKGITPGRTFGIVQEYAHQEYGTVFRQGGLLSGRQSYTFSLLLCCEQVSHLVAATARNAQQIEEDERHYYLDLAEVFLGYGKGRIKTVHQLAARLQEFLDLHRLDITCHEESWSGILETTLRAVKSTRKSCSNKTPFLKSIGYRLQSVRENFSLRNTQVRFAAQLSLIVSVGMTIDLVITFFTGSMFGIWIPITSFAILNTYNDETITSTRNNAVGTLIGIVVFYAVVHVLPSEMILPVIVTLSYLVVLMNFNQTTSVAAVTQMALTALYQYTAFADSAMSRLLFVIIAVTCIMAVIFVFLRTKRSITIRTKLSELERIDVRLSQLIHRGVRRGQVNMSDAIRLLYYLHMNAWLMDELASALTASTKSSSKRARRDAAEDNTLIEAVRQVLNTNYHFAMRAEHLIMLLDPRRADDAQVDMDFVRPDSTSRIEHIDASAQRLDREAHRLEDFRRFEDDIHD